MSTIYDIIANTGFIMVPVPIFSMLPCVLQYIMISPDSIDSGHNSLQEQQG
jgi:hypothetical protein